MAPFAPTRHDQPSDEGWIVVDASTRYAEDDHPRRSIAHARSRATEIGPELITGCAVPPSPFQPLFDQAQMFSDLA